MTTIQKRADELKPGNVLPRVANAPHRIVLFVGPHQSRPQVDIAWCHLGQVNVHTTTAVEDAIFTVEVPDLTPAQQHAEELLGMLQAVRIDVASNKTMPDLQAIDEVLSLVIPPEPPTLEEALEALRTMLATSGNEADYRTKAEAVLDRARRTGVLK